MERAAMALALASIDFCIKATFLASSSREALRSSPMLPAQEAADDDGEEGVLAVAVGGGLERAAAGGGLGFAAAGGVDDGAAAEEDKDRLDRDTRLSRASSPRVAGPWLRSS
jgi:hypothetical protein